MAVFDADPTVLGAAFAGAAPYVVSAQTPETLIVNTQGGEYQDIVETTVLKPFEQNRNSGSRHTPRRVQHV